MAQTPFTGDFFSPGGRFPRQEDLTTIIRTLQNRVTALERFGNKFIFSDSLPSSSLGSQGDWAFSADGHIYYNDGATPWVLKV